MFSQIKDMKHIEQNFHSVACHAPGWDLGNTGGGGVNNYAWGFAMAPHRLRVLVDIYFTIIFKVACGSKLFDQSSIMYNYNIRKFLYFSFQKYW